MNKEKCNQCKFFNAYEHDEQDEALWGACRRFPPVRFTEKEIGDLMNEIADRWRQPLVVADDWCGEFVSATPPATSEE